MIPFLGAERCLIHLTNVNPSSPFQHSVVGAQIPVNTLEVRIDTQTVRR